VQGADEAPRQGANGPKRITAAIMSNLPYLYRNLAGTGIGPGVPGLEQLLNVGLTTVDRDGALRP